MRKEYVPLLRVSIVVVGIYCISSYSQRSFSPEKLHTKQFITYSIFNVKHFTLHLSFRSLTPFHVYRQFCWRELNGNFSQPKWQNPLQFSPDFFVLEGEKMGTKKCRKANFVQPFVLLSSTLPMHRSHGENYYNSWCIYTFSTSILIKFIDYKSKLKMF